MKVATPEDIRKQPERNSPWGKPGAGAPLKEDDGSIRKNTKGRMQHEALVWFIIIIIVITTCTIIFCLR